LTRVYSTYTQNQIQLVQSLGLAHGGLDVQRLDVLPVLLEQGHEEVDGQVEVLDQLILAHSHVTDGNGQAEDLLHLELDGALEFGNLVHHVFRVGEQSGEFTRLGKTGTQQSGDLPDERLGSHESVVRLGKLPHQLLVLVQLLQVFHGHERDVVGLGLVAMLGVSEDAHLVGVLGNVGKSVHREEVLLEISVTIKS